MFKQKPIYLDYAATTPMDARVAKAMTPYYTDVFGNAGSVHSFGQRAVSAVDTARAQIAEFLQCTTHEVIFTSGATEADNLAILGVVGASQEHENIKTLKQEKTYHIVTTEIEHEAVLAPCRRLEAEGKARLSGGQASVTYVKPNTHGIVEVDAIRATITNDTVLVSVMYVNNETGAIQPIKHIGKMLKRLNEERAEKELPRVYFHVDAVQAANFYDCQVDHLHVDLLSLSGHKIYGPKGVGVLYVRKDTPLSPQIMGGGQQHGLRSGTIPVPLAVGMGTATSLITAIPWQERAVHAEKLKAVCVAEINKNIPNAKIHGDDATTSPAWVNVYIPNVDGIALITALDMAGIAVSLGAACSTGALKPSHVLQAMNLPEAEIKNSLRITFGRMTSEKEVRTAIRLLNSKIQNTNNK